jgi:Leucine-rich repeat (LRR) protein
MSKYIGGIQTNTSSVVRKIGNPTSISNCIHCYLFDNPSNLGEDIGSELDDLEISAIANVIHKLNSLLDLPICKKLYCQNNRLSYLPNLPECENLSCSNNQLTSLPDLPKRKKISW